MNKSLSAILRLLLLCVAILMIENITFSNLSIDEKQEM